MGQRTLSGVLAVFMIAAMPMYGCAGGESRKSTGEVIDDAAVTAKIKTRLFQDPKTSGFKINVDTYKGVVQLSGFADSEEGKRRAEELAREVAGVTEIKNDIVVRKTVE